MKNLKTLVLIAAITLGFNTMQAQEKFGHINMQELLATMPEAKAMQVELEKLDKTQQADLQSAVTAFQAKVQKYQTQGPTQTEGENTKRAAELKVEEQKLQMASQSAQQSIQNKQRELLEPIAKKANEAVEAIAETEGFKYIFHREVLVVAQGTDILPLVKAKLGITE